MQDPEHPQSGGTPPSEAEPMTPPPAEPTFASDPAPPAASPPPPAAAPISATPATIERPTGVTILAILAAIGGVFGIFGGLTLLVSGAYIGAATGSTDLGGLASLVGAVLLISGIFGVAFAWGAWGLRPWAWLLGVVIQAVNIVIGAFQLINGQTGSILGIAIAAGITYYLFQPGIKAAFGRT